MTANKDTSTLDNIQTQIWQASLPVEIKLSSSESRLFDKSEAYIISVPRLSYLPFLLPRLLTYFSDEFITDAEKISAETGYFSFEGVPLKWHLPVGLLYDIYVLSTQDVHGESSSPSWKSARKAEPFQLTVHFSPNSSTTKQLNLISPSVAVVHDSFINSVKEADFLRSGTAKPIMSLSATDSKLLWSSTQDNDLAVFSRIHAGLLPSNGPWRNIPLRVYLPSTSTDDDAKAEEGSTDQATPQTSRSQGQIRVIQSQIPPYIALASSTTTNQSRAPATAHSNPQTVGTALHTLLPSLFPSRRTPILAKPLLHGTVIPMNAVLEEVASKACYADGWVNIVVAISS